MSLYEQLAWGEEYHLENSDEVIVVHDKSTCRGDVCPIHKKTKHNMRDFPQYWRSDRGIMERTCTHGVGHPDPDDPKIAANEAEGVHGCDGCCMEGGYQTFIPKQIDQDGLENDLPSDEELLRMRMEQIDKFMDDERVSIQESINHEAHKLINGARKSAYGKPSDSFKTVANLWSEVLGIGVTPEQVILCMIQLKIVRAMHGGARDNYVDIAGYAGLSEMLGDSSEDW